MAGCTRRNSIENTTLELMASAAFEPRATSYSSATTAQSRFETKITRPLRDGGVWVLDIDRGDDMPMIVVEWRPDRGYGLSVVEGDDLGVNPDEVYTNEREAFQRTAEIIRSGGRTDPHRELRIGELRQLCGVSQQELADRVGIKQANISQLENRGDTRVSTLAKIVEALNLNLAILVEFPNGTTRKLKF
jgi:DNA-binding Xre family transcriptional regulator